MSRIIILAILFPVLCFSIGFVAGPDSAWYRTRELCEEKEKMSCFTLPDGDRSLLKFEDGSFVVDPVKVAEKRADDEARVAKEKACEAFRKAIQDMALSENAPQAAVGVAVRNMLGLVKNCGGI